MGDGMKIDVVLWTIWMDCLRLGVVRTLGNVQRLNYT